MIYRVDESIPDNLHLSVLCPQCTAEPLPIRVEQKFFITPKRIAYVTGLLLRVCRDEATPMSQVNSVYFDTVDFDQHDRSMSGELAKDKVRIRWYGEEYDPNRPPFSLSAPRGASGDTVEVWLELKSRQGFSSTKQRSPRYVSSRELHPSVLSRGIVPAGTLLETMAGFGFFPPEPIRPIIVISYFRRRLVEPLTGYTVTIDTGIRSSLLIPGSAGTERRLELPGAVVEVKCTEFRFPPSLLPLAAIGCSWTRFSKYSACLEAHDADRGTVSRLWPSGLMEEEPGPLGRLSPTSRQYKPPERRGR